MPDQMDEIERAKRSSRSGKGAVGKSPIVYQVARSLLLPQHEVLDYGAGKDATHTQKLREEGFNVVAHDFHGVPGVHDPEATNRRYDVVMASNVLNTQGSASMLAGTLNQIAGAVKPAGGMAIVNLPMPRYDAFRGLAPQDAVASLERALKLRFNSVERHPRGSNQAPVWILKDPKHFPPSQR